jgi:pyruvate/2-oxoglutarate dehydrogenase complex dihydrolipoamide dehydrogenase (E3) component
MNMEVEKYDIIVIGAGAGGLVVTYVAAKLGLNIALIEKDKMGGDCLNAGCVPSKALLSVAKHAEMCRHLDIYGMQNVEPTVDYKKVSEYVHNVIKRIEPHDSVERFEGLGAKIIKGAPKFIAKNKISINDKTLQAKYFVLATGSRAGVPPIPGLDTIDYFTNETIFDLTEKPSRLLVIGAGPIGIELSQAHLMLGTPVTVLDIGPMLPRDDQEAVAIVRKKLLAQGMELHDNIKVDCVEKTADGITIHYEEGGAKCTIDGSHLLVAAGRIANVENLDLEKAGVEYDRVVTVDKRLRTSNKSIFAVGDVAGGFQFTHIAGYEAGIAIRNILFKMPAKVDYTSLPWVTYTDPELAQVGLNELSAQQQKIEYNVTKMDLSEIDRFQAESQTDGFIKVLTDKKGTILGVTVVGPEAGELILTWGLAMKNGMRMGKVAELIAAYPTRSEISKRVAGSYFDPILFTDKTRKVVKFLMKF